MVEAQAGRLPGQSSRRRSVDRRSSIEGRGGRLTVATTATAFSTLSARLVGSGNETPPDSSNRSSRRLELRGRLNSSHSAVLLVPMHSPQFVRLGSRGTKIQVIVFPKHDPELLRKKGLASWPVGHISIISVSSSEGFLPPRESI
jgi:hypothetical protein